MDMDFDNMTEEQARVVKLVNEAVECESPWEIVDAVLYSKLTKDNQRDILAYTIENLF